MRSGNPSTEQTSSCWSQPPSPALPVDKLAREDDERFVATQTEIMQSQTLLRRTEQRMNRTADEVRENLTNLKVAPVRGADIIVISVDSRSKDFAKDFANTLAEEYLRFREEQRAQTAESVMLRLSSEIKRLGQELREFDERMLAFAKEHNVAFDADAPGLRAFREGRDRIKSLHDALLAQLMKIDVTQSFAAHQVTILEAAIVEPRPVRGWDR